jgi:uncharacterized protein YegL
MSTYRVTESVTLYAVWQSLTNQDTADTPPEVVIDPDAAGPGTVSASKTAAWADQNAGIARVAFKLSGIPVDMGADVVLILDKSGSMYGERMVKAKEATEHFVTNLLPEGSYNRVAYIPFNGDTKGRVGFRTADNKQDLLDAMELTGPAGGTNYYAALYQAQSYINGRTGEAAKRPAYILFMSDGEPNSGYEGTRIAETLRNAGVIIYSVGIQLESGKETVLKQIASSNEANEKLFVNVTDLNQLEAVVRAVAGNIRKAATNAVIRDVINTDYFEYYSDGTYTIPAEFQRIFTINNGNVTINVGDIEPEKEYYFFIKIKPEYLHQPDLYATNKDASLEYKDINGNDQTIGKDKLGEPVLATKGAMINIVYRVVNEAGQYLTDDGKVTTDAGLAKRKTEQFIYNGSAVLEEYGNYSVAAQVPVTIDGESYELYSGETSPKNVSVSETAPVGWVGFKVVRAKNVTINYVSEDTTKGTVDPASEVVDLTGDAVGSTATPLRDYYFVGWYNEQDVQVGTDLHFVPQKVEGKNVAATYTAKFAPRQQVNFTGGSGSLVYNGEEQSVTSIMANGLPAGYTYEGLSYSAKGTDVNIESGYAGVFTGQENLVIKDPSGNVVTGQFTVNYVTGNLKITPKDVDFKGESDTREYNGETQTLTGITPEGLVSGHSYEGLTYSASGKEVNTYPGSFSGAVVIKDARGTDVTRNYRIGKIPGSLTITKSTEKVTVTITGNTGTYTYDGNEKVVEGYTTDVGDKAITVALKAGKKAEAKGTNANTYQMELKAEDFEVTSANYSNIEVVVEDGWLKIDPISEKVTVTVTEASDQVTYDATEHTIKGYASMTADNTLYNVTTSVRETETAAWTAKGTHAGSYPVGIEAKDFANTNTNFTNVEFVIVDGELKIDPISEKVVVAIEGHHATYEYDGTEKTVEGYDVKSISNPLYTAEDFSFKGDAVVKGTNANTYQMGLKAEDFENISGNFAEVAFEVADGWLKITKRGIPGDPENPNDPKLVKIIAKDHSVQYDGKAHGENGYTTSNLAPNQSVKTVVIDGSQTEVGQYVDELVPHDAVIVDAQGVDVTANYELTYVKGTLTITKASGAGGGGGHIKKKEPLAQPELERQEHFQYIVGYEDGLVRPNALITREEVATIFYRLMTDSTRDAYFTTMNKYPDVLMGRWSNKAVSTVSNQDIIMRGYPDGNFAPGRPITRAEFATVATKFDNLEYVGEDQFSDISGHWAAQYINSAAKKGWIAGYEDGTFRPDQYITRAEVATLINHVLNRKVDVETLPAETKQWPDNPEDAWYYKEILEATNFHDYERAHVEDDETWLAIRANKVWNER